MPLESEASTFRGRGEKMTAGRDTRRGALEGPPRLAPPGALRALRNVLTRTAESDERQVRRLEAPDRSPIIHRERAAYHVTAGRIGRQDGMPRRMDGPAITNGTA
jgi:hypothetical protein